MQVGADKPLIHRARNQVKLLSKLLSFSFLVLICVEQLLTAVPMTS